MKVCVELGEFTDEVRDIITANIDKNWHGRFTLISPEDKIPNNTRALLTIGTTPTRKDVYRMLLVERVECPDQKVQDVQQLLFQANAKLGKMIRSDLLARTAPFALNESTRLSRRELFFGLKEGIRAHPAAPLVIDELCEARYGCSKCVEACPTNALQLVDGRIKLAESKCVGSGICVSVCPVSAIQLPRFSESAFLGLLEGLHKCDSQSKLLVITCDASKVQPAPWMCVEQVKDVGVIGHRLVCFAAASALSGFIVYCADGLCSGRAIARDAIASINSVLRQSVNSTLAFVEGPEGGTQIRRIYEIACHAQQARLNGGVTFNAATWDNYLTALTVIGRQDAEASGLGLTELSISDSCTLCGSCEKNCPHSALKVGSGKIEFEFSSCTGCGYCVALCPENSITLQTVRNIGDFKQRTIFQDQVLNCVRCGRPLDSAKFLKRVAERAGGENPMMKYCNSCKQQIAFEKLLQQTNPRPRVR